MSEHTTVNAYAYYRTPTSAGVLVERQGAYICEIGQEGWRHDSGYPGEFVKLVPEQPSATVGETEADDQLQWRLADLERRMNEQEGEL